MPELPEVETVRRGLSSLLPGRIIKSVDFDWLKSFPNAETDVEQFVIGAKVVKVDRRAKVLLIELSSKYTLVTHLKMTGQLVFRSSEAAFGAGHPTASLLGNLPGIPQPSQKAFETRIATVLESLDLARPLYVEGESARIGRLSLPIPLVARMRGADCIEVDADPAARLAYLLRDYAYLGDDREALAGQLGKLKELQGKAVVDRWQQWARAGELAPLFAELMLLHYDPQYERSQAKHFSRWAQRAKVAAGDLSDAGIEAVAQEVLALRAAPAPTGARL